MKVSIDVFLDSHFLGYIEAEDSAVVAVIEKSAAELLPKKLIPSKTSSVAGKFVRFSS